MDAGTRTAVQRQRGRPRVFGAAVRRCPGVATSVTLVAGNVTVELLLIKLSRMTGAVGGPDFAAPR